MGSDNRDSLLRYRSGASGRRIVWHKNQKSFRAGSHAEFNSQTSQAFGEESHAHSIAHQFAKTEEDFADSVSHANIERENEAQKGESVADSRAGRNSFTYARANNHA